MLARVACSAIWVRYFDFFESNFRCKDPSHIMWKNQKPLSEKYFEVECGLGGNFKLTDEGWPLCDSKTPKKCTEFLSLTESHGEMPPLEEIIEIINSDPQLPGGKVYYKCKQEGFISNIGKPIEINGKMEHRIAVSKTRTYSRSQNTTNGYF